ncbi:MAG: extracellular solute-binding protein [Deinococcales bacterium]
MKRFIASASLFAAAVVLGLSNAAAPIKVTFWHYVGGEKSSAVIQAIAKDFNNSQNRYTVDVVEPGDFKDVQVKLQAAAAAKGDLPSLVQVDNGYFTRLALGNQLYDATDFVKDLPKATVDDFQGTIWDYGQVGGKRLGFPWAASTLITVYNADAFRQKGLAAPRTWDDFVRAAKTLTSRTSKGTIFFVDGWIFGSMVSSRGGNILDANNKPDLDSSIAIATLQMMYDLTRGGQAVVRNFSEANFAVVDWVRTKAFMVTVPTSAFPYVKELLPFNMGAVPMPGRTIAGESQLVIPRGNSQAEISGALEFWQYLTRTGNVVRFSKESYYLPLRKSAIKPLGDFMNDPVMKAGMEALEKAYNPPHLLEYQQWRTIIETQIERSLKGGVDPKAALLEAQRLANQVK